MKAEHEFRDPIHGFIHCSSMERKIIDSMWMQRLRHVHQLAMTFLLYPSASHKRFEHSLGVMELATQVFDIITEEKNYSHLPDSVLSSVPMLLEKSQVGHWRQTVRMAALLHDVGHMPFSHAAEGLLPKAYSHERMTWEIVHSEEVIALLKLLSVDPKTVAGIAVGPKDLPEGASPLTTWEALLSEIITGNAFGADRMDYLLRDSHHLGVNYGVFDIKRLIPSLRISYRPPDGDGEENQSAEPLIGIEEGGLHSAASLSWARYSIFSQVYFHHIRRIYDIHLQDFLQILFPEKYPVALEDFLYLTDNKILTDLYTIAGKENHEAYLAAVRITERKHYKRVYHQSFADRLRKIDALAVVYEALSAYLQSKGASLACLRKDAANNKHKKIDFPVIPHDRKNMAMATDFMPKLNEVPDVESGYIFVDRTYENIAKEFLGKHLDSILSTS